MSWEGHLSGFIVGLGLALIYKSKIKIKPKYNWERQDYVEDDDEFMKLFDENGNFIPDQDVQNDNISTSNHDKTKIIYHYIKQTTKK